MIIAITILVITLLGLYALKMLKNFNMKIFSLTLIFILIVSTFAVCIAVPKMHKPFAINVVEYLIKVNEDGSVSTTKKTTETVIRKQQKGNKNSVR